MRRLRRLQVSGVTEEKRGRIWADDTEKAEAGGQPADPAFVGTGF